MGKVIEALSWLTLFLALIFLSGCSTCFAVKDPQSGTTYYTREIAATAAGAISFTDEKSHKAITVYRPEVIKLDSAAYEATLAASPAARVKPVGMPGRDETY